MDKFYCEMFRGDFCNSSIRITERAAAQY